MSRAAWCLPNSGLVTPLSAAVRSDWSPTAPQTCPLEFYWKLLQPSRFPIPSKIWRQIGSRPDPHPNVIDMFRPFQSSLLMSRVESLKAGKESYYLLKTPQKAIVRTRSNTIMKLELWGSWAFVSDYPLGLLITDMSTDYVPETILSLSVCLKINQWIHLFSLFCIYFPLLSSIFPSFF